MALSRGHTFSMAQQLTYLSPRTSCSNWCHSVITLLNPYKLNYACVAVAGFQRHLLQYSSQEHIPPPPMKTGLNLADLNFKLKTKHYRMGKIRNKQKKRNDKEEDFWIHPLKPDLSHNFIGFLIGPCL